MAWIELTKDNTLEGNLVLVSRQFPLIKFPSCTDMTSVTDEKLDIQMDAEAASALLGLIDCIHGKEEITAVSGFRTKEEQENIWRDSLNKNGTDFTMKYVAAVGCSEHHTGLAIDLAKNKKDIDFICPDFPETGIFQKFRSMAPRFGFIERYPAGKEKITEIGAEPWHFRYVGYPHSMIMDKSSMVLEEYILFLKNNTDLEHPYIYRTANTNIELSYIPLCEEKAKLVHIPDIVNYIISGTNEGGVVLCLWREDEE